MRYLGLVFGLVLCAAALNLADAGETGTSRLTEKENKDKTKDELADATGDEPSLLTDDDSEGKADQDNEKSDEMFLINGQQAAKQDMFVEDEPPPIDGVPGGDEPVEDPAPNGWIQHAFSWCTASGRTILKYGSEKAPITAAQCQALCVAKAGCKAIEHWNKFNYACFWCTDTSKITPYNNQNDLAYPAHVYVQRPPTTPRPTTTPTTPASNPCLGYKVLNTGDRLVGYTGQKPVRCDRNDITPGSWYRFTGAAGDRMPTKCPKILRCGTHAPGWLNGSHPSVADGIVTRKVCFHWSNKCCRWSNNIRVKNCGAYYVYELQKPALGKACSLRYCGEASECHNYKALDQADRAMGNTNQNNVKCDGRAPDNIVVPRWYRMTGASGDKIPESCVPMRRCGTHAPGWLNGSHPAVLEGAVTRRVCYHWSNNCCLWKNNIKIRNCGAYYVYQLVKPPACYLRYCGNNGAPPPTTPRPTTTPTTPAPDPCRSYKVLNSADRAVGNSDQNNVRCDQRDLATPGWYRFSGAAGDRMPTSCPPKNRCGTHAPGWLSGNHPSVAEGIVSRKVCYHWSSRCCHWSNNIKVKNCGAFFVYELQRTPVCSLRYCGNNGASPTTPRPTTTPTTPAINPCRDYKVLAGADRAVGNAGQKPLKCDQRDLATPGWYRFSGAAGDRMPTTCPPTNRCGTHAPGWLSGNHPSVADGVVSRKVCYHWSRNCCNWHNNIKVRNCGAFFVYELQRTPVCYLRYCGNNGASPTTPRPTTTPTTPTTPAINPCRDYNVLAGADRAVGNAEQKPLKCDQRDLATPGWYRFSGAAGDRMPTTCPPKNRCGTHAPGWLNGSYPTVADGVVSRKVCYHWSSSCCNWHNNIKVRNCGAFYVFELQRTPVCWLRYCGNNGALPTTPRPTTTPTTPTTAAPDPCRSYKDLKSADRAVGHVGQRPLRCDQRDLPEDWYRFSGAAGDRMPTSCVPKNRCGTHAPGWLNGSHPSVADGIVTRRVCYHWSNNCCLWKNDIRVKNCYGSFFVYYLKRTPVCYLRYCGNNGGVATTRPPTPTRPTTPPHPEVNVTCGKNEMWISIPKSLMHGLDREHLRLNDVNCGARETRTHFILHTKLTECHTKSRHTKNFVCYMNNVLEIPVQPHQIITRVREVEIPFSCYYSNMGVVSAVGLQVKSKKIMFSKKGFGKFVLEMDIYPDHRYLGSYKKKDFPLMVQLRKILYVEVSVDTEDRRLAILAEECFATPQPDPSKPGLRYTFIKDGCAVDDTVNFIPTADKRTQRFSLEAFSFIGDHQFVFMHCRVKICNATDPNSRCAQGCLDRRKRSLITQESKDEEAYLAEGPFMRGKDEEDETQLQETDKELRDMEKSAGRSTTATIALATVAVVCLVAVTYYIYDKKKQSGSRVYRPLAVPAE